MLFRIQVDHLLPLIRRLRWPRRRELPTRFRRLLASTARSGRLVLFEVLEGRPTAAYMICSLLPVAPMLTVAQLANRTSPVPSRTITLYSESRLLPLASD